MGFTDPSARAAGATFGSQPSVQVGALLPLLLLPSSASLVLLAARSEEHMSELQSHLNLVCRLLLDPSQVYPLSHPLALALMSGLALCMPRVL